MKRSGVILFAMLVLVARAPARVAGISPAPLAASGDLRAVRLRCEYRRNPLGIDERSPRLSWQLASDGRNQRQSAYRVLVATSRALLDRDRGDAWDSGRVVSDQQAHLVYRGRPLRSRQRYFWKVQVWDALGRPSPWSEVAWWEMGLLEPGDWRAKWISIPPAGETFSLDGARWVWFPEGEPVRDAPRGNRYFRRTVEVPADRRIVRATFAIAADNEFRLFVNGSPAGRGSGWEAAQRLDLTTALGPGRNTLAIMGFNSEGPAGILARLQIEFETGAPLVIDLDDRWKAAATAPPGWQAPDFDDSNWVSARVLAPLGSPPWGAIGVGSGPGPAPYLRREFRLRAGIARARLYVTALGVYEARLNGRRVGEDLLAPGWTDYRKRVLYQTHDVTGLVRPGANALGAIVGDGWYNGALGNARARNHFGPPPPRFLAQLEVDYRDGRRDVIVTDEQWHGAHAAIRSADFYAGETYDARLEPIGWDQPGFAATGWKPVTLYSDRQPRLQAEFAPPIRITGTLRPVAITQPQPGVYVFDLGQNMVGWARLRVRGPAGTEVRLRFAEVLNPDGTLYVANLRSARATDTYILGGRGTEVWEPHFTYHGFRYVEVTGYPGTPTADAIEGRVFHTAAPYTSRFQTNHDLVNRLYRNVLWGLRGNLMSVPTDCPQRDERLGWMGDAQLFARTSCWYMDLAAFYNKWMVDIVDAQSEAGGFSDVSPRVFVTNDGAPAWADAGIIIPWTVYQCYGDTRILERHYPAMRRYVELLVTTNPELLWLRRRNNDYGDWVAAGEQTNKELIASAYLAWDLQLMARIARILGHADDARRYDELARRARDLTPSGDTASRLRRTDVPVLVGDPSRFHRATGWAPRFSLRQSLRDLYFYWKEKESSLGARAT
mgnify:CR=1 FL=1